MANKLYNETYIQNIADSLRLKGNGISDKFTASQMGGAVLGFPFGNIPVYHCKEAGRVIKKLLELKETYPNHLLFGAISDNHADKTDTNALTSVRHAAFALETVGAMAGCDFVVNLGDNLSGTNMDTDTNYADTLYTENAVRYAVTSMLSFNLVGNHEKSDSTQKIYDLIGKYNAFDSYDDYFTPIRGYGYKDFADKKVRVIALNTCDYMDGQGGNGMSYEQKSFLMRSLDLSDKDNPSEWLIVILSHIPLDFLGGDYNKGADLKAILKAYNEGASVSIAVNSSYASQQGETPSGYATYSGGNLVYNYSGKNAARIINIHGHIHNNAYGKLKFIDDDTELDIMRISTANSSFSGNKSSSYTDNGDYGITTAEAAKIAKQANSKKDTSATFYFIDLEGQTVHCVGYGADIDRTVIYKKTAVYNISYNLGQGITNYGETTSVAQGSRFEMQIELDTGYSITTVSVTMGGVDVTDSVRSGTRIVINEVTGDVVISVTTVDNYLPHWDIGDRTAVSIAKSASGTADISRHSYYLGAADTGAWYPDRIIAQSVSGNDITFTGTEKNIGVGVPLHLEAGANYTFSATASVKSRLRVCFHNADGSFMSGGTYSSSGTSLSMTFTAPTDPTAWVMLLLDCYTAGQEVTYTNVAITKN